MDNLTHSLTGLALARAGLDRFCPRATWLLVISANAPDVDIIALTRGQLAYLEAHRGYTHSVLALPLMAILCVVTISGVFRQKLPWTKAWLLCCVGLASHLLLDCTNSFGVRLLIPFESSWYHFDLNSLTDASILVMLLLAAIWPLFTKLVSSEIGERSSPGRGSAILALAFFLLFDGGRAVLHQMAVSQLQARLYDGFPPLNAAALPGTFSPFRWRGIVETGGSYRLLPVDALGQLNTENATTFYKPPVTASLENAGGAEPFRYFLYFARFPVWSVQPVTMKTEQGKRVDLTDLRFGVPGAGGFHAIALENAADRVLQSWFTFGSGRELGWDVDVTAAR